MSAAALQVAAEHSALPRMTVKELRSRLKPLPRSGTAIYLSLRTSLTSRGPRMARCEQERLLRHLTQLAEAHSCRSLPPRDKDVSNGNTEQKQP